MSNHAPSVCRIILLSGHNHCSRSEVRRGRQCSACTAAAFRVRLRDGAALECVWQGEYVEQQSVRPGRPPPIWAAAAPSAVPVPRAGTQRHAAARRVASCRAARGRGAAVHPLKSGPGATHTNGAGPGRRPRAWPVLAPPKRRKKRPAPGRGRRAREGSAREGRSRPVGRGYGLLRLFSVVPTAGAVWRGGRSGAACTRHSARASLPPVQSEG